MRKVQLSDRLQAVADYVSPQARLADIGSDHAYLPAYLIQAGQIDWALAGEVAQGPLDNVKQEISRQGLNGKLIPRLANGLAAINPSDQVDTVTIAGMGGVLISQILAAAPQPLPYQHLILQPNTDVATVRDWLIQHGFKIDGEQMVQEGRHFYEVLSAVPGAQELSDRQLAFGPYLLEEQGLAFRAFWQHKLSQIEQILNRLEQAQQTQTATYQDWQNRHQEIQEVLSYGKRTEAN
ncbi:class I SAM-dependent methyltransferase [Lactobacillaceae bacterium L1_55_11]|nr:class I SAM-dependent methyltransferase [Lactobacillaceae bacterium L1_55_11]